ncbi:MAG: T9SS type A sorting domain-containing protein [Crocinitomicaceae bacterium]|nr:MAG: T9SS type A sorting domain-containing protein [Crocinitomicaceae bacterium]
MKKMLLIFGLILTSVGSLQAQDLYDRATVQTIEIFFSQSNWDALMDNLASTTEDYLVADSVRINGISFDSVGVKYKGNSSYNANNNKNPLHINLDYVKGNQDYQGYTNLKLQNGYQDPSMIREVLSYAILEQYMDCPKANFANVYINGTLRGLYSNAQSINDDFNGQHYYSTEGAFFKCNPIGGAGPGASVSPDLKYINADTASYANGYELQSNYGWYDLVHMIDTLNNNFAAIESVLDVDRALWMLAFNNVLVNLDSYSGAFRQNYYLYKDLNDRFVPTVWDLNMSFAGFPGGTGSGTYTATSLDPMSNSTSTIHPLIVKMLGNATYKKMYMAHIRTIVQEIFASGDYLTTANTIRNTIDASVQADPYKFYTYTQYQNSLTTAVTGGGGPGGGSSIPGIQALMDARVTYFNTNANYILVAPTITSYAASNPTPAYGETITITATVSNETTVYLGYRLEHPLKFTRVQMFDDGAHNDGAAGDHVYGAPVIMNTAELEYYIYTENANAGLFSPQRAEHEYHSILTIIPLAAVGEVVVNEIMASNNVTADDNYGESDDWIELYNTTSGALSIAGLWLSDDPVNMSKWQVPAGTIIEPNGYLIIWTDEDGGQSGLHTNFKLGSTGESVIFSDGMFLYDQVDFPALLSDQVYARCPDAGTFTIGDFPTFAATNNCFVGVDEASLSMDISVYPVPTTGNVFISSKENAELAIQVVDLQGRLLYETTSEEALIEIPSAQWNAGFYHIRIQEGTSKLKTVSFIKE